MKREEYKILVKEKQSEGKNYDTIEKEILTLENSQKLFKNFKSKIKSLEIEIKNKKNIILKKDNEIKVLKKKNLINGLNQPKIVSFEGDILHIRRIINNMPKNIEYTKTDIIKDFFIPNNKFDGIMSILYDLKFLTKSKCRDGTTIYKKCLN